MTMPGRNGGTLKRGNNPGTGGDTNSMARRIRMESIAQAWLNTAPTVAKNPKHPAWLGVGKLSWEAIEGKAPQSIQAETVTELVIRVVKE